jgi:hypothetical protein
VPRAVLVTVAAAGLLLSAAAPAAARTIPFGFNDATSPQRLADSRALGASVGRYFLCWCDVEPEPGRYDFAFLDRLNADFAAHDIRPVISVLGTPSWARAECATQPRPCLYPPDDAHLPQWREFFRLLAQRYPHLYGLEVWNEGNLVAFWRPRADAARYARLLKEAYAGVKSADPDLPVVAGSPCLCGGGGKGGLDDVDFLAGMYRAGAKGHFDALSVHDYPTDLPVIANARDKLTAVRKVRARYGDRTPIWLTEAGLSSAVAGSGGHPRLTEPLQARALAALGRTFRQAPDIGLATFFRFADITGGFTTWEDGLGIAERADGSRKPAGAALAEAMREGVYTRPARVRVTASTRRVEVGRPVVFRVRGRLPKPQGPRLFLWDVGGGGFFGDTGARPIRSRVWKRPGRYRVGVRAGDQLDAGEGFTTVVVTPRRSRSSR